METPAMEEVIRKTPPSGLSLNVGAALRRRWRWDLVLMAQHWFSRVIIFFLAFVFQFFIFYFYLRACFSVIFIQNRLSGQAWGGRERGK